MINLYYPSQENGHIITKHYDMGISTTSNEKVCIATYKNVYTKF